MSLPGASAVVSARRVERRAEQRRNYVRSSAWMNSGRLAMAVVVLVCDDYVRSRFQT